MICLSSATVSNLVGSPVIATLPTVLVRDGDKCSQTTLHQAVGPLAPVLDFGVAGASLPLHSLPYTRATLTALVKALLIPLHGETLKKLGLAVFGGVDPTGLDIGKIVEGILAVLKLPALEDPEAVNDLTKVFGQSQQDFHKLVNDLAENVPGPASAKVQTAELLLFGFGIGVLRGTEKSVTDNVKAFAGMPKDFLDVLAKLMDVVGKENARIDYEHKRLDPVKKSLLASYNLTRKAIETVTTLIKVGTSVFPHVPGLLAQLVADAPEIREAYIKTTLDTLFGLTPAEAAEEGIADRVKELSPFTQILGAYVIDSGLIPKDAQGKLADGVELQLFGLGYTCGFSTSYILVAVADPAFLVVTGTITVGAIVVRYVFKFAKQIAGGAARLKVLRRILRAGEKPQILPAGANVGDFVRGVEQYAHGIDDATKAKAIPTTLNRNAAERTARMFNGYSSVAAGDKTRKLENIEALVEGFNSDKFSEKGKALVSIAGLAEDEAKAGRAIIFKKESTTKAVRGLGRLQDVEASGKSFGRSLDEEYFGFKVKNNGELQKTADGLLGQRIETVLVKVDEFPNPPESGGLAQFAEATGIRGIELTDDIALDARKGFFKSVSLMKQANADADLSVRAIDELFTNSSLKPQRALHNVVAAEKPTNGGLKVEKAERFGFTKSKLEGNNLVDRDHKSIAQVYDDFGKNAEALWSEGNQGISATHKLVVHRGMGFREKLIDSSYKFAGTPDLVAPGGSAQAPKWLGSELSSIQPGDPKTVKSALKVDLEEKLTSVQGVKMYRERAVTIDELDIHVQLNNGTDKYIAKGDLAVILKEVEAENKPKFKVLGRVAIYRPNGVLFDEVIVK